MPRHPTPTRGLSRRHWLGATASLALATLAPGARAQAQAWPTRPVELVVPYPPGASTDLIARTLQNRLAALLGQPVVIDNRGGAGGNIGAAWVARSAPDGYRLLLATNAITTINPHVTRGANFDAFRDLVAVAQICNGPMGIAVRSDLPVANLGELVAYAKKNPGKLSYGSAGNGSPHHVIGELLKQEAGVFMVHVPYRGIGPAMTDLLGGNIQVIVSTLAGLSAQAAAGKIRILATAEPRRFEGMPQVPTVAETFPGFEASAWFGLYAPVGTPAAVIARVNTAVNAAVATDEVRARLLASALGPATGTPEAFAKLTQSDHARWGKLVREKNIQAD